MSSPIIAPGPGLARAAQALESRKRAAGAWPYQWIFPGPHSKPITAQGVVPVPAASTVTVVQYQVSEGMRFSLRGVVAGAITPTGTGWSEGTSALSFTLQVTAAGDRNVEYLVGLKTRIGSLDQPYPIIGCLEFDPLDILTWICVSDGSITLDPKNVLFAHIVGYEYPLSEAI